MRRVLLAFLLGSGVVLGYGSALGSLTHGWGPGGHCPHASVDAPPGE